MEETHRILVLSSGKQDCINLCSALTQTDIPIEISEVSPETMTWQNTTYDCIFLLDHQLSITNTFDTINKLLLAITNTPIIVILNEDREQDATQIIDSGATECITHSECCPQNLAKILRLCIQLSNAGKSVAKTTQTLRRSRELLEYQSRELSAQKQLIQLQHLKLLEVSQLKSQFLATISHELRTPMNAVIGFTQIFLRPKFHQLTLQQKDILERILSNGNHLLMLLNQLIELCGVENGDITLKSEIFDLSQLIKTTNAQIHSLADEKHLSIVIHNRLENHIVFNDIEKLKQVFRNLLLNAIKFTESGHIWVEIEELPANKLAITVRDTGIGIATGDIEHIFERFWQVYRGNKRRYAGTGLGLAIAHSLVQIMCGNITVSSHLGEGSAFRVEIPRQISSPISQQVKDVSSTQVAHSCRKLFYICSILL